MDILLSTFTENIEDQQSQNFCLDDNVVPKKQMKRRSDYSNTKVKTRNLLTNVSYRRFTQSDFNKNNFIVDILSFLVQNFNPVNLDIKLDTEHKMVKFMWDECIPNEFVSFIYKHKYYTQISQPSLTYQKTNTIVKEYLAEDINRINHLKFKIEEKFDLIHFIYSLLFSKIYNRTNSFGIQKKNTFEFHFQTWKTKKTQKFWKQLSIKELPKDPSNYRGQQVENNELPIEVPLVEEQLGKPTMVNEIASKQHAEKRKKLEKRLVENTAQMSKIKKKL